MRWPSPPRRGPSGLPAMVLALGLAAISAGAQTDAGSPEAVVADYAAAVSRGDEAAARRLWSPDYLAEAERLGITYLDTPCAWDLASPVVAQRAALAAGEAVLAVAGARREQGHTLVTVTVAPPDAAVHGEGAWSHTYGLVREEGSWRLANRIWQVGRGWEVRRTRYCRLHLQDPRLVDPRSCEELDRFIAAIAESLGAGAMLAGWAAEPVTYHVADDSTVAALTGYPTRGMVDLASGAVISSHFPHHHELVHLLVNRVLGTVPPHTLPLVQEGLASRLGGRWGRSPAAVLYTAWLQMDLGMLTVADILTRDGFLGNAAGPDGTYALAALVCDLVVERAGWPALLRLHRDLSADAAAVASWSRTKVARAVGRACGWRDTQPTRRLEEEVIRRGRRWRRCGIEPGWPAGVGPLQVLAQETAGEFHLAVADGSWACRVRAGSYPVVLLLDRAATPGLPGPGGSLYREHLPDVPWAGSRWGLVCRPDNVGLYDYVSNTLEATWVAGFTGEDELGDGTLEFTLEPPPALAGVVPDSLAVILKRPGGT